MTTAALVNDRTRKVVARAVEMADTRATRRKGLLGRTSLDPHTAMFITPCFSIHTCFMQFPIDVVFLDRDGRAVRIVHAMKPWRMAVSLRGRAVIELAAGRLDACEVKIGDRLYLNPHVKAADAA